MDHHDIIKKYNEQLEVVKIERERISNLAVELRRKIYHVLPSILGHLHDGLEKCVFTDNQWEFPGMDITASPSVDEDEFALGLSIIVEDINPEELEDITLYMNSLSHNYPKDVFPMPRFKKDKKAITVTLYYKDK